MNHLEFLKKLQEFMDYKGDKKPLNEGGHTFKDVLPIRGDEALDVANEVIDVIKDHFHCNMVPLGSTGKKTHDETSGDIDIAVDLKWSQVNVLVDYIEQVWPDTEYHINNGLKVINIGFPYDSVDGPKKVQIDFMFSTNVEFSSFYYHSPDFKKKESNFKGLYRTNLLVAAASYIPVDKNRYPDEYFTKEDYDGQYAGMLKSFWKYTLNGNIGLYLKHVSYEGKNKPLKNPKKIDDDDQFVSDDPKIILKFVLGPKATMNDIQSYENLVQYLLSPKYIYRSREQITSIFDNFFKRIASSISEEDLKKAEDYFDEVLSRTEESF